MSTPVERGRALNHTLLVCVLRCGQKKIHTFPFSRNDRAVAGDKHSDGSQATEALHGSDHAALGKHTS